MSGTKKSKASKRKQNNAAPETLAPNWKAVDDGPEDDNASGKVMRLNPHDKDHEAWSPYLARTFGNKAATAFCIGSDILLDELNTDLVDLSHLPKGTHLGELDMSPVFDLLPAQFATCYDYDFVYRLNARLELLRQTLHTCNTFSVHMVADELLLHMIELEAESTISEAWEAQPDDYLSGDWVCDICEDSDLTFFLYTPWLYLDERRTYHFAHWFDHSFYGSETDAWYTQYAEYNECA